MAERWRAGRLGAAALLVAFPVLLVAPAALAQEDGKAVYEQVCAACHQADGGGLPGLFPPLAGNPSVQDAEYVRSVILNGLQGEIQVLGQTYNGVMPAQALSDAEVDAVIGYLQTGLGAPATTTTTATGPTATLPEGEVAFLDAAATGRGLFLGSIEFANGGPACFACHSAGEQGRLGGPGLGPDLTDAFAAFGGRDGLQAAVTVAHGDVMAAAYADEPLTAAETAQIAAYLEVAAGTSNAGFSDGLVVLGLAGLVALAAWVALIRSGRDYDEETA